LEGQGFAAAESRFLAVILRPFAVILSEAEDPFHLTQDRLRGGSWYFAQGRLCEESLHL
jgi:hypothetical protein